MHKMNHSIVKMESATTSKEYILFFAISILSVGANAYAIPNQGTWEQTLLGRDIDNNPQNGYEAYYDTQLNITWLTDSNYLRTTGAQNDGFLEWSIAAARVGNISIGGISGWRLPGLTDTGSPGCNFAHKGTDCGYNTDTTSSELSHMYYVTLGNKAPYDVYGYIQERGAFNTGVFKNLDPTFYWSGTEYALGSGSDSSAWSLVFSAGYQRPWAKADGGLVWAVRSGDIANIPEPGNHLLALAGLVALSIFHKKIHDKPKSIQFKVTGFNIRAA